MARLRRPDIKIIYLTGYNIPGIDKETNIGPVLRKPIEAEELVRAIAAELADSTE